MLKKTGVSRVINLEQSLKKTTEGVSIRVSSKGRGRIHYQTWLRQEQDHTNCILQPTKKKTNCILQISRDKGNIQ